MKTQEKQRVLEAQNIKLSFGGLLVLNGINLNVELNEIVGLIGPNGAGKTTFLNVISGNYKQQEGKVFLDGNLIDGLPPYKRARLGCARTFQIPSAFLNLTVFENVRLASCFGARSSKASAEANDILESVGLGPFSQQIAGQLNVAGLKRLELARALAMKPKLLLLDEVMAGLNTGELDKMIELVLSIRSQGISILMIEHLMRIVMSICDRIIVLHHGTKIAEGTPKEIVENEEVIKAYLGSRFSREKRSSGIEVFKHANQI